MPNLIQEIEESLNKVEPLQVSIRPVMETAPQPDPVLSGGVTGVPGAYQQPLQADTVVKPEAQPVPSTGAPVPQIPQVDALSYGNTITQMSAESAAEIKKALQGVGVPKPNEVQKTLLNNQAPVQINTKYSTDNNPFSKNTPKNAAERLSFQPPKLANGMFNPFSNADAIAAVAAGVSQEEYLAYIEEEKKAGNDSFGKPFVGSEGYIDDYGQVIGKTTITDTPFAGLSAEQIRKKISERTGYLGARREFNRNFLPLSGGEDRSELETLFAALAFPSNLFKGIVLDATQIVAAGAAGTKLSNFGNSIIPLTNWDKVGQEYNLMRPTQGGTFTGAAVLGENFSSLAVAGEANKPFNPLAVVRDDSNIFQAALGLGLDILADPLNSDALASRLFNPLGKSRVREVFTPPSIPAPPSIPTPPSVVQLQPSRVAGALPPAREEVARVLITPPNPSQSERVLITKPPQLSREITVVPQSRELAELKRAEPSPIQQREVLSRELATIETLTKYEPIQVEFPTPARPFIPIPNERAIVVSANDIALYDNVVASFNDSPDSATVERFMRDVVEQTPFEQIPDARALVVVQNPMLREVVEYARTGDITPNIAVLQGASASDIAGIVADRLELARESPIVVPRIVQQPIEVPRYDFDVIGQLPKSNNSFLQTVALTDVAKVGTPAPTMSVDLSGVVDNTGRVQNLNKIELLAARIAEAGDNIEPVILRQINPTKFEVIGDNTNYLASRRASELNPNTSDVRAIVVQPDSALEKYYLRQQESAQKVSKLSTDAIIENSSTGAPSFKSRSRVENTRTFSVELDNITTTRGGAYSKEAVEKMALEIVDSGENIRPIVVRRTGAESFELIRGNLEYLAARRVSELDPNFTGVRAYIVDAQNEVAMLAQLDILDGAIPVSTSKPIVLSESTSLTDLKSSSSSAELNNWVQKGDFRTPLQDVLNAVDDLGIEALNTPSLAKLVKARVGKVSNVAVKEVADSLTKVQMKGDVVVDVAKSTFDGLWRKSTEEQKQIIVKRIPNKRLLELGLERAETKITPATVPTIQHAQASIIDLDTGAYTVINDSQVPLESLRVAMLREQGFDGRTASRMKVHPISEEIALTAKVSDSSLADILKEMSVASPAERNWSSKMLQQVWEVATPAQRAKIMTELDASTLNQLGVERIARSNVIDDHLPPETIFDVPC